MPLPAEANHETYARNAVFTGPPFLSVLSAGSRQQMIRTAKMLSERPVAAFSMKTETLPSHAGAYRAVVVAETPLEAADALQRVGAEEGHPALTQGDALAAPKPVFVAGGKGGWRSGMAADLLDQHRGFWDSMLSWDAAFTSLVEWSLLDLARGEMPTDGDTAMEMALHLSISDSLAGLWIRAGVSHEAVLAMDDASLTGAVLAGRMDRDTAAAAVVQGHFPRAQHHGEQEHMPSFLTFGTFAQMDDVIARLVGAPGDGDAESAPVLLIDVGPGSVTNASVQTVSEGAADLGAVFRAMAKAFVSGADLDWQRAVNDAAQVGGTR